MSTKKQRPSTQLRVAHSTASFFVEASSQAFRVNVGGGPDLFRWQVRNGPSTQILAVGTAATWAAASRGAFRAVERVARERKP